MRIGGVGAGEDMPVHRGRSFRMPCDAPLTELSRGSVTDKATRWQGVENVFGEAIPCGRIAGTDCGFSDRRDEAEEGAASGTDGPD
jgi:hypothetical protein